MPFDSPTRNKLQKMVASCRRILTEEFTSQFQGLYGIQPTGVITSLASMSHLDDEQHTVASLLRERVDHLAGGLSTDKKAAQDSIDRVIREQAFTVLNRLAALRMCEERGIVQECIRGGFQSRGFQVYCTTVGASLGGIYDRYRVFLQCVFDEISVDLGVLFDRFSPLGLLFPREPVLVEVFKVLNDAELTDIWKDDETIGWIYQYFNSKEEREAMRKASAVPRNSRDLAVRNQFFTPRYVVEFLTDNTLGRIWYEMTRGETRLSEACRSLVRRPNEIFLAEGKEPPQVEEDKSVGKSQEELLKEFVYVPCRPLRDPREIRILDPACGSMHFGLYAFDLYEYIYEEAWDHYPELMPDLRDAYRTKEDFLRRIPELILRHNIHGIDIDPRACQIAGLSLWLRVQRSYQRLELKPAERPRITRTNVVCAEPMPGEKDLLEEFISSFWGEQRIVGELVREVWEKMQLAGEAGSLLRIEEELRDAIGRFRGEWERVQMLIPSGQLHLWRKEEPRQLEIRSALKQVSHKDFWEVAEDVVLRTLEQFVGKTTNGKGYQRLLFAEDAARGFAFIDLCRKMYDVVLMNPPFGEFSKQWKKEAKTVYPDSYNDVLGAFIERFHGLLNPAGRLGAITSRACFFLASFSNWRSKVVLQKSALSVVADLGHGIMDDAMVEAAAYVLERSIPRAITPVIRAIASDDRLSAVIECLGAYRYAQSNSRLFLASQAAFRLLPDSPFVYWISSDTLQVLLAWPKFKEVVGEVRQGLATADNPRFVRAIWEAPYSERHSPHRKKWVPYILSGPSQPWFSPITLLINWARNAAELWNNLNSEGKVRSNIWMLEDAIRLYFFKPGFSWTRRAVRFIPYIVPEGCVPSASRYMAFPKAGKEVDALGVCASRVVTAFLRLFAEFWQRPNFLVGNLKVLPWPVLAENAQQSFSQIVEREMDQRRRAYQNHEPFHEFLLPQKVEDFSRNGQALAFDVSSLLGERGEEMVTEAYGLTPEQAKVIDRDLFEAIAFQKHRSEREDIGEEEDNSDTDFVLDFSHRSAEKGHISYLVGCAFGSWDIRIALDPSLAPELPDPFDPLPACAPGMLVGPDGLPAKPNGIASEEWLRARPNAITMPPEGSVSRPTIRDEDYPLRITWSGILVDELDGDEAHAHLDDVVHRVREVLDLLWGDRAHTIEQEACEILGVTILREYFRKPSGFFDDHLKRYSKSRRKAPIYWPLSTESGSYTLWIYYHRLTDQTLYHCVMDFADPKLEMVGQDVDRLHGQILKGGTAKQRDQLERLQKLQQELADFREELLRVAALPYRPNLNDGVIISASPLHKLFRLPRWRKDLEECWKKLESGEYDWAHLAYSIWPDRVREKCRKDKSIAIAHGLEELYEEIPAPKKTKRGKKSV